MQSVLLEDLKNNYGSVPIEYFCEKYQKTKNQIYQAASANGFSRNQKITEQQESTVVKLYFEEKKTIKQIRKEISIGRSSIGKILAKHGGGRSNTEMKIDKLDLDATYFKEINTPEKAYWLGFIAADGNVYRNRLQIGLAEKDRCHLILFAKAVCYSGKIHEDKTGPKLIIARKEIFNDLNSLGILPNKSLNLNASIFDKVPTNFLSAFMHGYFDGDGGFSKRGKGGHFTLLGNLSFLNKYREILVEAGLKVSNPRLDKRTKQTYYISMWLSPTNNQDFINFFYLGGFKSTHFLSRKFEKIASIYEQ